MNLFKFQINISTNQSGFDLETLAPFRSFDVVKHVYRLNVK